LCEAATVAAARNPCIRPVSNPILLKLDGNGRNIFGILQQLGKFTGAMTLGYSGIILLVENVFGSLGSRFARGSRAAALT
jgi:hypothetical protein